MAGGLRRRIFIVLRCQSKNTSRRKGIGMKLVKFELGDYGQRPGLVKDGGIVDLSAEGFRDSIAFMSAPASVQADVAKLKPGVAMENVKLLAPVQAPPRIFGIGVNYAEHAAESGTETQKVPTVFIVLSSSVVGPGDDVVLPKASTK